MKKCKLDVKLLSCSLASSLAVLIYVVLVALIMFNGEKIFGEMNNFWGPVAFLMLFLFSALITAFLILGKPIYMYFDGKKDKAVKLFFYNIGWLFVITVIVFLFQII